jgi:hydrogenase-1 operon protein HyaF
MTLQDPVRAVPFSRGNVKPLLNEIVHALDRLLGDDEPTVIDLASLPFAPGELAELEAALGTGELTAELDALGKSLVRETAYPGVWWLDRYIEVTRSPEILMSQDADIAAGRAKLRDRFGSSGPEYNKETGK